MSITGSQESSGFIRGEEINNDTGPYSTLGTLLRDTIQRNK
jgi:hypothetical protein